MKIKPEHLDHIRLKIHEFLDRNPTLVADYEHGKFASASSVRDLQIRFNFDMFYAAGLCGFATDVLYRYMDDSHLTTALKHVCPHAERKY